MGTTTDQRNLRNLRNLQMNHAPVLYAIVIGMRFLQSYPTSAILVLGNFRQ